MMLSVNSSEVLLDKTESNEASSDTDLLDDQSDDLAVLDTQQLQRLLQIAVTQTHRRQHTDDTTDVSMDIKSLL